RSAPVTFRVTGECGAPGIIVVRSDGFTGTLTANNGDAVVGVSQGRYHGAFCPFRLELGDWTLENRGCSMAPDAGSDARVADAVSDAGGTDAGDTDAGGTDAGAMQSGFDAGLDAGRPAALLDAGPGS